MPESLKETLLMGVIVFGTPAILVWLLSAVLDKVAALKALPDKRAKITVGIPYAIAVVAVTVALLDLASNNSETIPLWVEIFGGPLFPLPAAALLYLHYRADYRKRWVESAEDLPDGVDLANDDWRVGIAVLALFALIAAFRAFFRLVLSN